MSEKPPSEKLEPIVYPTITQKLQPMGIGKLGQPHLVFVRKFRWLLKGKYLPENWNQKVKFNHTQKTIELNVLEVVEKDETVPIHHWLKRMDNDELKDESLVFTTFDGCGKPIYAYKFTGIKLKDKSSSFDYSDSDVSTVDLVLSYNNCRPYKSTESVILSEKQKNEEVELNFLNAKTWRK